MSIVEYEKQLRNFDWYYEMSDDPIVYSDGRLRYQELVNITKQSEEYLELFDRYYKEKYGTDNY